MTTAEEYKLICDMVATCPLEGVALAWKYACENGVDTAEENYKHAPFAQRHLMEMGYSLNSLPSALEAAYSSRHGSAELTRAKAERALQWWRNRGYTY